MIIFKSHTDSVKTIKSVDHIRKNSLCFDSKGLHILGKIKKFSKWPGIYIKI